jgi:hypothetical protein
MLTKYGSSKLAARHYENDADDRAEKITKIKRKEVDDIVAKASKIRKVKMGYPEEGKSEEKPRMKQETKTPYDNFLEDCIVVDGKREISKREEDKETSSPVPAEWAQEIQKALDGWRDAVFIQEVEGVLRDKSTQKISKQE